jgi:DNA modification methylase
VHGTQKPLECMRRPIVNNSAPGESVYDPFLGSGTTLIAAELTRRICFGIAINPRYCDVTIERWQRLTGSAAILDGDGRCFADLKDQRVAA